MQMTIIALIISIIGLIMSFFMVGILPSIVSLIMGIILFVREEEKSIGVVRIIAISAAGILLPIIMYLNAFGFALPEKNNVSAGPIRQILAYNYSNLGIDVFDVKEKPQQEAAPEVASVSAPDVSVSEETSFAKGNSIEEKVSKAVEERRKQAEEDEKETAGNSGIFESLDSIAPEEKNKGGIVSIAASDDNMPSYGGLPVGTLLVAQYFREDDHNCNPVLVLQNKTGDLCRYECRFIARDPDGEEMAISDKTVEVVRDGAVFVFEGRFDKRELGGKKPDAYEFSITKRAPYEKDMANQVSIYTAIEGTSALLTAENKSDKKVKVDAYVLFFDNNEMVDCMWMIPQNTDEVCLEPGTSATIEGDAYYRFDRVETFYTAYEAVGQG